MPRACRKKDSGFEKSQTKSVFLYGRPNKEKCCLLHDTGKTFLQLVNDDILVLAEREDIYLQLIKNSKKDSEIRVLEKTLRPEGLSSAFCQAAFDTAVTHLSNRLDRIRLNMFAEEQTIFTQSKVLFAMMLSHAKKQDMIDAMLAISKKQNDFYASCAEKLTAMTEQEFYYASLCFQDSYVMHDLEYKIPQLSSVELPLDSRLMRIEESTQIKAPYVISITDPFHKGQRIQVPLSTSKHSINKIRTCKMAGTVKMSFHEGVLRIGWSYTRSMDQPKTSEVIGVDTGITDLFYASDGNSYSSMQPVINYYKTEVEPAFAELSNLRNKKRKIQYYLHKHPGLPEDVRRSLIQKIDKLEHMMQTAVAPYRKNRRYYAMLDHEIKVAVSDYIKAINHNTLTVIERLDIREFHKSRKLNGMFSMFARGKAQETLMKTLNWKGFDFMEVAPDYTSQICPVCHNLDKNNRNEKVFRCTCCGYTGDADYTASLNIRERAEDKKLLALCKEHRYSRKGLQKAIRQWCEEKNQIYKQQNLPVPGRL